MNIDEARNKMKNYANSFVILPLLDEVEKLQAENEKLKTELDKHRWIPVSERLPENQQEVLVTNGQGAAVIKWSHFWADSTHWKPIILPESEE